MLMRSLLLPSAVPASTPETVIWLAVASYVYDAVLAIISFVSYISLISVTCTFTEPFASLPA